MQFADFIDRPISPISGKHQCISKFKSNDLQINVFDSVVGGILLEWKN